jgi:hypothetical protein
MVDLFGKGKLEQQIADLRAKIAELELERSDLLAAMANRDEKNRRLAAELQEANVEIKKVRREITEASVIQKKDAIIDEKPDALAFASRTLLPREALLLEKSLTEIQISGSLVVLAYSGPNADKDAISDERIRSLPEDVAGLIKRLPGDRGFCLFYNRILFAIALVPPFPLRVKEHGSDFTEGVRDDRTAEVSFIHEMLDVPIILVYAHAGLSLICVALGSDGLVHQETIKSQVMGKHSKGGWSQRRFERLREEDVRSHANEVMQRLEQLQKEHGIGVEYIVLSGDPILCRAIAECATIPVLHRRLRQHDPQDVKAVIEDAYSFLLYRAL